MIAGVLVHVPYWWHATLLEILWLLGGVLALPVAIANIIDARKDIDILADIRGDPTIHSRHYYMIEEAAHGKSFNELLTIINVILITATGIIACVLPNPLMGATTITGLVVTVCLDGIAAVTALRSHASLVRRRRMYELAAGRTNVIAAEIRARNIPKS